MAQPLWTAAVHHFLHPSKNLFEEARNFLRPSKNAFEEACNFLRGHSTVLDAYRLVLRATNPKGTPNNSASQIEVATSVG